MKQQKIRIAIADDHQVVIDDLLSLLQGNDRLQVAITTTDHRALPALIKENPVDILLTDVMMPQVKGDELVRLIREQSPKVKILVLTVGNRGDLANNLIEDAGIAGYILKNAGKRELISALENIAGGGIYFSEELLVEMTGDGNRKKENMENRLTDRELEIIRLIEQEFSNKQIAETLYISERTVETHRKNIFRKTRTNSVIGLIKYAYEHKLV